jgi:ribosomal-protein-alanine N-acetyltransferase
MSETVTIPVLEAPRLRLRPLVEADAADLHEAYGDAETMRYWDAPASGDIAETAARIRQSRGVGAQWHAAFAVTLRDDDRFVGMVNYHARLPWHRRLAVGWIVTPPWRRQGIMREAMSALLDHCFRSLDTHRIEAHIEPDNTASVRLAERLGFAPEGLMRDWLFVGGQPRSLYLYALLRPAWHLIRDPGQA